ncbi:MAG TPA: RNA 2',3'-cyclic phosphodiesterase [Paenalcaligenes sp.]|nr:RNA 2',3'-cyclic phosphodiesterase [Paenalcaligenes sp.]
MSKTSTHTQRIFIGLWPNQATQAALQPLSVAAQQYCGGRALRADQWHITLAFLGDLPPQEVQTLCAHAAEWQLPIAPFQVDRYGCFERARIIWAGSQEASSLQHMSACHQQLWQYLTPLGYRPEPRPFVPHISLLRQAQSYALSALPDFSPFAWQSAQCYVMESRPTANGTHYLPLGTIALQTIL